MKTSLLVLLVLLAACGLLGCGESKGEACITQCSSADHCFFYKKKFCPSRIASEYEDICIGGRLYKCRTPPESPCCEGLRGRLTDFGSCGVQTEGCAADAPAPDSNWWASDGDGAD